MAAADVHALLAERRGLQRAVDLAERAASDVVSAAVPGLGERRPGLLETALQELDRRRQTLRSHRVLRDRLSPGSESAASGCDALR
jgi:hypothetical protein